MLQALESANMILRHYDLSMSTHLVFINKIYMYANTQYSVTHYSELDPIIFWRAGNFSSLEGPHFFIWSLLELGLTSQAQLNFQALSVKEVFTEGVQTSEGILQVLTHPDVLHSLVGVVAPSNDLSQEYFQ